MNIKNNSLGKVQAMKEFLTNEEIINFYKAGIPIEEIVRNSKYRDKSSIYRILKKNGVTPDRNPKINLSNEEINNIVDLYNSSPTVSAVKIGKKFNISGDSVMRILREKGVSIREQPRKHIIDEQFFDRISPNVIYIVGLIQTDGTIHKDLLGFSIIQKDYELLEKIAKEMGVNSDIIYKGVNNTSVLIVRSKKMVKSLIEKFKLHPNKSKTLEFPPIPEELVPSMLRGNFDGDGHFSKREAGIVTASESFALSLYDILQNFDLHPILNLEKPNETWLFRVYVRGKNNLKSLENILYSDGSQLFKVDKRKKLSEVYK
jgi:LAGLIDADG-like domain